MPLDEAEIANLYSQTRHLIRLVNRSARAFTGGIWPAALEKVPCDVNAIITETLQALEPLSVEKEILLENDVPRAA